MNILDLVQGSPEWHAHRATHFNASDAPAMMGVSKYVTRTELLREKATGIPRDVDERTQKRFDDGHASEAAARPIVEARLNESLFPATGSEVIDGLPLSASFDGITMSEEISWENKLRNLNLVEQINAGELEPHYYWQLEQQLLVSGAQRVYFTSSDGTEEGTVGMWYESVPERRARLIAGWKQFAEDLANYQPTEQTVAAVAEPVEALPVVHIEANGKITLTHNLERFGKRMKEYIAGLPTKPETDQDFANLDKAVKVLKEAEEALDAGEKRALSQTSELADMRALVAMYRETARTNRLMFEKLVKAEKENRKSEIVSNAAWELQAYVDKLNERIGGKWMPGTLCTAARFSEVIKGLKSIDSMRDKVSTALANAMIEANEIADTIQANRSAVPDEMLGLLFPDFGSVCTKSRADFANLMAVRVAAHREAEEKRLEAERERIRQEEADKQRLRDAITANNQTQFTAAALDQADTGTGVLTISSEGVEHVPVANFSEAINQAGSQNPTGDLHANAADAASFHPTDAAMITEFLALQACSPATKKEMRTTIEKWEVYRVKTMAARGMEAAA